MNVELDFKKSYVLEYLREQVSHIKPENGVFEFEVSQRDFESYKANPQYGDNAMRDINKQLSGGHELGTILDLLTEETQGEFILKSIKPQIRTFTESTDGKLMGEMVTMMVRGAAKELGKDPKKVAPIKIANTRIPSHWEANYSAWTVEYHPENAGKPRVTISNSKSFIFHLTKDRELVQVLPDRQERMVKLAKQPLRFLLELQKADHTYLLARDIATSIDSPLRYVHNLAAIVRKAVDQNFVGITGKEFIESAEGYRLSKRVTLKEM